MRSNSARISAPASPGSGRPVSAIDEFGNAHAAAPPEDHQIDQGIGAQPIGAMHTDAGGLPGRVSARHHCAGGVDDHFRLDIGRDAAHGIVRGGLHRHRLMHGVDAQISAAEIEDVRQLAFDRGVVDEVGPVAPFFGEIAVDSLRTDVQDARSRDS